MKSLRQKPFTLKTRESKVFKDKRQFNVISFITWIKQSNLFGMATTYKILKLWPVRIGKTFYSFLSVKKFIQILMGDQYFKVLTQFSIVAKNLHCFIIEINWKNLFLNSTVLK